LERTTQDELTPYPFPAGFLLHVIAGKYFICLGDGSRLTIPHETSWARHTEQVGNLCVFATQHLGSVTADEKPAVIFSLVQVISEIFFALLFRFPDVISRAPEGMSSPVILSEVSCSAYSLMIFLFELADNLSSFLVIRGFFRTDSSSFCCLCIVVFCSVLR